MEKIDQIETTQSQSINRLLVVLEPRESVEQLVRWGCKLAQNANCPWTALFVETSALTELEQASLTRALSLAFELGAEVITTTDSNVVRGVLRAAAQRHVSQIIVGQQADTGVRRQGKFKSLSQSLLQQNAGMPVLVVPGGDEPPIRTYFGGPWTPGSTVREYTVAIGAVLATTLLNEALQPLLGYRALAWVFLASVVLMAGYVGRGATILAAALSALLWDFLFEPPIFTLYIEKAEDRVLFVSYFVVAVTLGQLTNRIRKEERAERQRQERATALQLLTRQLSDAASIDDVLFKGLEQTASAFKAEVAILQPSAGEGLGVCAASKVQLSQEEKRVAAWVFENRTPAGKFTGNFSTVPTLHMPINARDATLGVLVVRWLRPTAPTIHERNLLEAFSGEIGAAVQRFRVRKLAEESKLLVESERLGKTLLNTMSHEIRTPLTAIQNATSHLMDSDAEKPSENQKMMLGEIQEATDRLNRLVGRVLDMTRLESGPIKPRLEALEAADLATLAISHTKKETAQHNLVVDIPLDLPLLQADFELTLHALTNLLSNAAFHTPAGSEIHLSARVRDGNFLLIVEDNGPGIPPDSLPRLFEKFYRAPNARTGGTGLGLSLVKGFVEAQGGSVKAQNRPVGGAAFTISLPLSRTSEARRT